MSATDVIAVIALVVSIGAGAAAILSLVLQFRESGRRNEEIRLLHAEAERRDEELRLLGQQVQAEQDERLREQQARLSVFAGVQGSGSERGIEYTVPVQNTGASPASQIAVELFDSSGAKVGTSTLIPTLVPGEKAYTDVVTPPRDRYTGPYEIFFEWDDGRGRNRAASGVQVGSPAP
jgi:hypothetical protein